jgi:hypothetical protein
MNASASSNDCDWQAEAGKPDGHGSLDSNELNPLASLLFMPTVLQNCSHSILPVE